MTYLLTPAIDKGFEKRRNRVLRRNAKLTRGYLTSFNHDGLAIARVRPQRRRSPLAALLLAVAVVIAVKAAGFALLGQAEYDSRIARLGQGTLTERAAAFLLQADPLTAALADRAQALLD